MRWLPLLLSGVLCFGATAKKPSQPDKVHLSLTYSERNGLAFPSAGGISLLTASLLGGAAVASALGGMSNFGTTLNDIFSGKDAGVPKTGGETERMLSSPEGDALVALASRLPLSCNYRAQLEADLVWDVDWRAYVVSSGTLIWTGRNNSRFESKGVLLYCNLSGGGTHHLKRDEVRVKFSNGNLSKTLAAKGKQETPTYELILAVKPEEQAITGDAGSLSQVEGHVFYQTQDRFTTAGQMTNVNVIDGTIKENLKAEPLLFSKQLAYQAEEREIRGGNADFAETWVAPGGTQTAIRWTFNPDMDVEVSVEMESAYESWLPEGNLGQPSEPGNNLRVKLKVFKKGDPTTPRKANLKISLPYVSKNQGVCMNWPAESASGKEGLRFRKEDFQGEVSLKHMDDTHLESKKAIDKAEFQIHAYDFGAWGTLRVTARDLDGKEAKVKVRGKDTPDLSIPLDDNGNRIADSWETAEGVKGQPADSDDDDTPSGKPSTQGDGLTLYEEYRGFSVKGAHIRTKPKKKDLFICDTTGLAGPGIDLFEKATKLVVHRVTQDEMGAASKIVNRNAAAETHAVDQHGILIVPGPAGSDPEAVAGTKSGNFGPPVMTAQVQIPAGGSYDSGDNLGDMAHELGHAVGLAHHGDKEFDAKFWFWKADDAGAWQLYEQAVDVIDGKPKWLPGQKPISVIFEKGLKPFTHGDGLPLHFVWNDPHQGWLAYVGGQGSQFSGDQECLMRYYDKQAYKSVKEPERVRYIPDPAEWKMRTRLCDTKDGTGVNKKGRTPQSRYGDAVVGECSKQVVVNDKYASK